MRLPAEWEPQRNVLFTFPRRDGDWGPHLDEVSEAMLRAANLVNDVTPTIMIISDPAHWAGYAQHYLGETIHLPTNDCWVRDYGPLTCLAGDGPVLKDFTFNGWGGKFRANLDDAVPARLHHARFSTLGYQKISLELEGGSIESDGRGTLLTTTKCLLNINRNGGNLTRARMESRLQTELGANRILWLEHGYLEGDDTDAHVDTLARFLDPGTIAYVRCDDPSDSHYPELRRMELEIRAFRRPDGTPYRLIPLPWCPPINDETDGHRLPATYANFLISNGHLFLPTYYDDHRQTGPQGGTDDETRRRLQELSQYHVVPVPCRPFLRQHGSLHCLTMQIPRHLTHNI